MIDGCMQDYPLTLDKILHHAAKWHPGAQVVTATETGVSHDGYATMADRARGVSGILAALGIGQGDRVATLAWNSQAHVEVWYAVMGMGAVCHTLNPRLTAPQLAAMVIQSEARVLVVSADLLPLAREITARATLLAKVLVIDGELGVGQSWGAARVSALEPLIAEAPSGVVWGDFAETAACGLCFTSGTTGAPKGVSYTHRSNFLHAQRLLQVDGMAISARDAVLVMVPMFHANAWGLPFAVPAAGAKLVLPGRRVDGAGLAELIAAECVTVGVGVPTVWLGVVEHVEATGTPLPSLERVIVGGSPLAPALMERIEQTLGVTVQTSWGMTELSPSGTVASPNDPSGNSAVSGKPALGVDLLITDAAGTPLPQQRDHEGHLWVRGAAVIARYFGEETPAIDADGWFDTGDLARIDVGGNLIITGRAKDLIKSGGEWINPAEIEAVVGALPEVSLAAVIGREDAKWGERPVLLVEMRGELSDDDLLAPLRDRVASWWIPDAVLRIDAMPLAPTGKIDKIRLRTQYGTA